MNAQAVLLVVSFLAAATLAIGGNVPEGPSSPLVGAPADATTNRNAKQVLGKAELPGPPPGNGDASPDDLKADSFFLWGGYGGWGGWGGWGYPRYGGWGWGYRRPYYGGWYGW